jgi:hypothetical protein
MTKKELLESSVFKAMPDDAEFVFATSCKIAHCAKLRFEHLSLIRQVVNEDEFSDIPFNLRGSYVYQPKYMVAAVINAVPYDHLQRNGILLKSE